MVAELLAGAGLHVAPPILAARLDAIRRDAGTILIAVEWGSPSGLVALHWHPVLDADGLTAQITTLLVAEEARRRGIGRLLVKAAAQSARVAGCDRLLVSTHDVREDVAAFCRATGFADGPVQFSRTLRKAR